MILKKLLKYDVQKEDLKYKSCAKALQERVVVTVLECLGMFAFLSLLDFVGRFAQSTLHMSLKPYVSSNVKPCECPLVIPI